jgi:hypothetical protein
VKDSQKIPQRRFSIWYRVQVVPTPWYPVRLRGAVKAFSAKVNSCAPLLQHRSSSQLFAFRNNGSKYC